MTHHTEGDECLEEDCVKCFMKQLAMEYWGEDDPTDHPIAASNDPGSIATASFTSGRFNYGAQEDAVLFYNWLLDQLLGERP